MSAKDEQCSAKPGPRADWAPFVIGVLAVPVFFVFAFLGNPDMGFAISLVLAMAMFAIKIHWKLRKHLWFWATIGVVVLLHVPLFFVVKWPRTDVPMVVFALPIGLVDFLVMSGALSLAEKWFTKEPSST